MYIKVLSEDNVLSVLYFLKTNISYIETDTLNAIYEWIMDFKPVLISSSWFIVVTAMIFISIPLMSLSIKACRNKKLEKEDF
jgi:hypothetical protein